MAYIVNKTNAHIILSSDWRYDKNSIDFQALIEKFKNFNLKIYDYTPELEPKEYKTYCWKKTWLDRGDEINSYLCWYENNFPEDKIGSYVVLDDRVDFIVREEGKIIRINPHLGLTESKMNKAIQILNEIEG